MTLEVERHWREISAPVRQVIDSGAAEDALADNPKRKGIILQNIGTTVLKFTLGAVAPTQTVYHFALKGGTVNDDGGGSIYLDAHWTPRLQVISSVDGGLLAVAEIT